MVWFLFQTFVNIFLVKLTRSNTILFENVLKFEEKSKQYKDGLIYISGLTNQSMEVPMKFGDNVDSICQEYCERMGAQYSDWLCVRLRDIVFGHYYGTAHYCPSRSNSNKIDYLTDRSTLVQYFLQRYKYHNYLEIGTDKDVLFNSIKNKVNIAVGVDPKSGGTLRMTSDKFFQQNVQNFDLIFIDGLHEANQVFRDVQNSLMWLNDGGSILLHDCNPHLEEYQTYPYDGVTPIFNGDTWKSIVALRKRLDIEIVVVDVDYGVGVVRRRSNNNLLPPNWDFYLGVNPISMLEYSHLETDREILLRLISVRELIDWLDEENNRIISQLR